MQSRGFSALGARGLKSLHRYADTAGIHRTHPDPAWCLVSARDGPKIPLFGALGKCEYRPLQAYPHRHHL